MTTADSQADIVSLVGAVEAPTPPQPSRAAAAARSAAGSTSSATGAASSRTRSSPPLPIAVAVPILEAIQPDSTSDANARQLVEGAVAHDVLRVPVRAHNYVFNYDHMIQDLSRPADPEINSRSWSTPKGSTKWRWEVHKDGCAWQWIESNIPSQASQASSSDTAANQALTGAAAACAVLLVVVVCVSMCPCVFLHVICHVVALCQPMSTCHVMYVYVPPLCQSMCPMCPCVSVSLCAPVCVYACLYALCHVHHVCQGHCAHEHAMSM